MSNIPPGEPRVTVPVKSAWLSKINWTQGVALVAALGTFFGFDLDAQTQASVLAGIVGAQAAITWALKTFFTNTVTESSLPTGTGMRE